MIKQINGIPEDNMLKANYLLYVPNVMYCHCGGVNQGEAKFRAGKQEGHNDCPVPIIKNPVKKRQGKNQGKTRKPFMPPIILATRPAQN